MLGFRILFAPLAAFVLALSPIDCWAHPRSVVGLWYLELDVAPFGLPPGTVQGGLLSFQGGGTMLVVDAGDPGGAPIDMIDTAQLGTWKRRGSRISAVGVFLRADAANGDPKTWVRVHFDLERSGDDQMTGLVRIYELACDGAPEIPFALFRCPDPVAGVDAFVRAPDFDLPVRLSRIPADLPGEL